MSCLKPHQSPASKGGVFLPSSLHGGHHWVSWGPIKGHETRENIEKRHGVLVKIWRGVRGPILCVTSYFRNEQFGVCLGNSFWRTTCFFEPWALELTALGWNLALVRLLWYHYRRWWKSVLRRQLFCCEVPSRFPRQAEAGLWGRELSAMSSLGDKI